MFCLNKRTSSFSLQSNKIDKNSRDFIKQQFKIGHIAGEYNEFADVFLAKCAQDGLYKPLFRYYIEQTLAKVAELRIDAMKTDNEGVLEELINNIDGLYNETNKKLEDAE